ncbi:urea ABC transporter permease subunit UrtB, partial [Rhodopseudomonas palustris]
MPLIHLMRILFAAVAIAFATLGSLPAMAGPYEDAIAQFAQDSFSDSEDAIGKLVASGNPRAAVIITALQDGKLYADPDSKAAFIKTDDGKIANAATGEAVGALPAKASAVRLNNKLRRVVAGAMAGLTLLSPDLDKRIQAAQSVFKSHDETMLPTVEAALKA